MGAVGAGMPLPQARRELAVPCGCERHVTFRLACAKPECIGGERWLRQRRCPGSVLDLGEFEHRHSHIPLVAPLLAGALGGLASQHPDEHTLNPMSGHRRCFASDPLCDFEQAAFFFLQLLVIFQPVSFFKDGP